MRRFIYVLGHLRGHLRKENGVWVWRHNQTRTFPSIPGARQGIAEHYGVPPSEVHFHIA